MKGLLRRQSHGWRDSRLLSWLMLGISLCLLASVVWARGSHSGAWRHALEGEDLGDIPVMDVAGNSMQIAHPATIYFFETNCGPCAPVTERLNQFVASRRPGGLPVYALTNSMTFSRDSARLFVPGVQPLRLRKTTRELKVIKELPLVVQTDAEGRVLRAYVGQTTDAALTLLSYPPAASPAGRP
jgi:hypothetical protein